MLTAFFRFIYLPACDAVARVKYWIYQARVAAVDARYKAEQQRKIAAWEAEHGCKWDERPCVGIIYRKPMRETEPA